MKRAVARIRDSQYAVGRSTRITSGATPEGRHDGAHTHLAKGLSLLVVETGRINLQLTNIGQSFVPHPLQRRWAAQVVAWRTAA